MMDRWMITLMTTNSSFLGLNLCSQSGRGGALSFRSLLLVMIAALLVTTRYCSAEEFNVLSYGAVGDGTTDDTYAFKETWTAACGEDNATLYAPDGYSFLVSPVNFTGPCGSKLTFMVDGTVIAPSNRSVWTKNSLPTEWWIKFSAVSFTFNGAGEINGAGSEWWASSCKIVTSNPCVRAPSSVTITSCNNIVIQSLRFIDAQQMHLYIDKCTNVSVQSVTVTAPANSPNTDGIHLTRTTGAVIENAIIGTGDDCISIQSGTSDVRIESVSCGPGHGISVGGLGKNNATATVSGIVVSNVVFLSSTNGVRIKTWQGASGSASGFKFSNILMVNTSNPILIDQFYCDSSTPCENQTSAIQVSDVTYENITGTSFSTVAVNFKCSTTVPCTGISLQNISLVQTSGAVAQSFCASAQGTATGAVVPTSCLLDSYAAPPPTIT